MSEADIAAEVIKTPAHNWLLDSYMPFTQYAIRSRALVSDDGLKPVQRRILWTMFRDNIGPESEHMKAARVAGNTVAFHPHGGSSIEDALARMAQKFNLRVPLVDPYGSVGGVTGDTAAAARYWEARLTREAMELLKETRDDGIAIGVNFDGKLPEPAKLPVRWPVAIINGTEGIAVGYASKMFAHNPTEIMDAARAVLKNPDISLEKLMKIVPGPDLPTGGELIGIDGVRDYFATGSGTFIIRGRYNIENLTRGRTRIVFYELPYQVSAEKVMLKINAAQAVGKFKEIASVKDLTDKRNGMRLVIDTKAGSNHLAVINQLFKETSLEERFPVNATVLVDGRPVQTSLVAMLQSFLELRRSVTLRKAEQRGHKIDQRLYQLGGLLAVTLDIDKAIKIIRGSETAELARTRLSKDFKIELEQADYILSMQLRRLTKADSLAIKQEQAELKKEKAELAALLKDPSKVDSIVDADLVATRKIIASPRRTVISGVTMEEAKEEQKVAAQAARAVEKNVTGYVTRFADGRLIRTDEPFAYGNEKKLKYSPIVEQLKIKTQERIALVGSDGLARAMPVSYITKDLVSTPEKIGVRLPRGVKLVGFIKLEPLATESGLLIGTRLGETKLVKPVWPAKDEFPVVTLAAGDSIVGARWASTTLKDTLVYFETK